MLRWKKYFEWILLLTYILLDAVKKLTDLTEKVGQISEKGYDFLLGRMYFTGDGGYKKFLIFVPMPRSLILDNKRKVTKWILTGILSEIINPLDTNLEPTMSNLTNGKLILKFNNSVIVQKKISMLLNLYIVYELTGHVILPIIFH